MMEFHWGMLGGTFSMCRLDLYSSSLLTSVLSLDSPAFSLLVILVSPFNVSPNDSFISSQALYMLVHAMACDIWHLDIFVLLFGFLFLVTVACILTASILFLSLSNSNMDWALYLAFGSELRLFDFCWRHLPALPGNLAASLDS